LALTLPAARAGQNPALKDEARFLLKGCGRSEMLHLSAGSLSGTINKVAVSRPAKYSAARVASVLPVPSELLGALILFYFSFFFFFFLREGYD